MANFNGDGPVRMLSSVPAPAPKPPSPPFSCSHSRLARRSQFVGGPEWGTTLRDAPDIGHPHISQYRYPDLTPHAEFLYEKIEDSIERDVHRKLVYLQTYDRATLRTRLVRQLPNLQEQAFSSCALPKGACHRRWWTAISPILIPPCSPRWNKRCFRPLLNAHCRKRSSRHRPSSRFARADKRPRGSPLHGRALLCISLVLQGPSWAMRQATNRSRTGSGHPRFHIGMASRAR